MLHINSPLLRSSRLSALAERCIWLKFEALQPAGSFKIRGIGHACEQYKRQGCNRFVSSSGGNAGLAVAYAGRVLSVPVTVVVPESTSARAQELISQEGAEVRVHGASWQEANEYALSMVSPTDAFIHPFDHPLLWEGHATLIDEVVQAGCQPDAVVLSVGGGGLLAGVVAGLQRNGLSSVPVIAVETKGAESFQAAVQAGEVVELKAITSIATTLGAKRVSQHAFDLVSTHPITNVVVSDRSAVSACEQFLDDHRMLVEPSCGASLSVAYEAMPELIPFRNVLVVVCGGSGVTRKQLEEWGRTSLRCCATL
jgi:L-serine/L-threonine ammonia-lyase